jgi:RNA polymerase sigma-70 factor (ECF subfamily)
VYGLVVTIVRDRGTAEDVAQETFVRAWRHAGTYDPRRGRVSTWLLTIARNTAIDAMRARKPEPLDPDGLAGRLQENDETARPEEGVRFGGELAGLREPQRRALFLAAFAGRTAREIAELEHTPLGTIKTRIRAAMTTMRTTLEAGHEV